MVVDKNVERKVDEYRNNLPCATCPYSVVCKHFGADETTEAALKFPSYFEVKITCKLQRQLQHPEAKKKAPKEPNIMIKEEGNEQ